MSAFETSVAVWAVRVIGLSVLLGVACTLVTWAGNKLWAVCADARFGRRAWRQMILDFAVREAQKRERAGGGAL